MISNPSQHTILVSGATGQQGGAVVRHLLKSGFAVRALTRNVDQTSAHKLADAGAEVLAGDLDDRLSLDHALRGVHGAYSVQGFAEDGVDAEIRRGITFAEAAHAARVAHFIYSSSAGAINKTGVPHLDSKRLIEGRIRDLGLPNTILRPVAFMDNWATFFKEPIHGGIIPLPLSPGTPLQQIAVDNIGGFVALAFSDPNHWLGRAVEIAGDRLTMLEMARVFSRTLKREIKYVQVPWKVFKKRTGEEITRMYRWYEEKGYEEANIDALCKVYPPLTRLGPFLRTQDWTAAAGSEKPAAK